MFEPYKKGTKMEIGYDDELITVHLPPVGWRYNGWTGEMEKCGFINGHLPPKQQRVKNGRLHPELPDDYKKWLRDEYGKQKATPHYRNPHAEAFRTKEWENRMWGIWIKIYNPKTRKSDNVYLTGLHYFYLFYWKCDFGMPDFRFVDLEIFYLLKYCEQDPKSNGFNLLTARRIGKTAILGAWMYEYASRTYNAYSGLQSKTTEDAQKVFALSVIYPWKNLPDFFRPIYDTTSGQRSELAFRVPTHRGKKAEEFYSYDERDLGLYSIMNYRDSGEFAYDGYKMHCYGADEVGKTETADTQKRHYIVKPTTEVGNKIIGKMFYTTTVEDTTAYGVKPFRNIWKESRFTKKNKNGKTRSGLYNHFIPAYKNFIFDDYGRSLEDESKEQILNELEELKGDPVAYAAHKRKYPFSVGDAFMIGSANCVYNENILNERLNELMALPPNKKPYTQGDFYWVDKEDGEVGFVHNPGKGKFIITHLPDVGKRNQVSQDHQGDWLPLNDAEFALASDPISHTKTVDPRASKAAAHGFMRYKESREHGKDPANWTTHMWCLEYLNRPDEVEEYFEDMIMACRMYGCQLLCESNKNNLIQHFKSRGYGHFIMYRPETTLTNNNSRAQMDTEGIPASRETIDMYITKLKTFINRHGKRIPFERTIEDLLRFDPLKTKEYDLAVSAGWSMLALEKEIVANTEPIIMEDWFNIYKSNESGKSQIAV